MGRSKGEEEEELYQVEVVTKVRVVPISDSESESEDTNPKARPKKKKKKKQKQSKQSTARWEYHVKWLGYPESQNTWEPEENLASCSELLTRFWAHLHKGDDDPEKDWPVGTELAAEQEWIDKESERSIKTLTKKKPQKTRTRKKKSTPLSSSKASSPKPLKSSDNDILVKKEEDEDEDIPLSQALGKRKRTKKAIFEVESEAESEHPQPRKLPKIKVGPPKRKNRPASPVAPETSPLPPESSVDASSKARHTVSPMQDIELPTFGPSSLNLHQEPHPLPPESKPTPPETQSPAPEPRTSLPEPPVPPPKPQPKVSLPIRKKSIQAAPSASPTDVVPPVAPSAEPHGIAVKRRLAEIALTPTTPKDFGPLKVPKPNFASNRPLSNLTIKKLSSTPHASRTSDEPRTPTTPAPSTAAAAISIPRVASPIPQDPEVHTPDSAPLNADTFLEGLEQEGITAIKPERPKVPPGLIRQSLPAGIPKIPKIWSWNGPLFLKDDSEPICRISIHDVREVRGTGMRFSIALAGVKSLRFETAYDIADIHTILDVFTIPSQLALIKPNDEVDYTPLAELALFLEHNKQVLLHPIDLDENTIGYVMIFPSKFQHLYQAVRAPWISVIPIGSMFVAALLTFTLNPEQRKHLDRTAPSRTLNGTTRSEIFFHQATNILPMNPSIVAFFTPSKTYSFWPNLPTTSSVLDTPLETIILQKFLKHVGCSPCPLHESTRAVLIHVSGLPSIGSLPGLAERRKTLSTRFFLYGNPPASSRTLFPRLKELYPSGGVVTFTPLALLHHPFQTLDLIEKIDRHPQWIAYLLPVALGMLAKLTYLDEDVMQIFDRGDFIFSDLLTAIEEGRIALTNAPRKIGLDEDWIAEYGRFSAPSSREALQQGLNAFNKFYATIPEKKWLDTARQDTWRDMEKMQQQYAIMFNYRRFVNILASSEERPSSKECLDWVEWSTTESFDFQDEWYPKQ